MEVTVVIAYLFGLVLLYFVARILLIPIKLLVRLIINGIIGGLLLVLVNIVGLFFDIYLPINPITALIAGFLGIPGVILLIVLQFLMVK